MPITGQTHDVLGTPITTPVDIRSARCFVAGYSASAGAVAAAIAADAPLGRTPLRPLTIRPGRTMCLLVFVDYIDGDLGPYNEFGICFLVEDPGTAPTSRVARLRSVLRGDACALVHRLPVDGEFTLAAGRGIWGFPKTMAEFDVDHDGGTKHGQLAADGRLIARLDVRRGIPLPTGLAETTLAAYSQLDGVLRMTPWRIIAATGARSRIGGASLVLGDHPMADELRDLRLSRHALFTSSVDQVAMSFADATVVSPTS